MTARIYPSTVWRAHVFDDRSRPEMTIFVEATDYEDAARKIATICRQMHSLAAAPVDELFYNLRSGRELVDTGVSTDEVSRLFETGWRGDEVTSWVDNPMFVVSHPALLMNAWRQATQPSAIRCADRMPAEREHVLIWETARGLWSVGKWCSKYQQWSNRDDPEYAIHPHQVSHWSPLPMGIPVSQLPKSSR